MDEAVAAWISNKENAIQGWNIVNHSANYKVYKDPNNQFYNDGVELVLTIERKSSYYVFKVILPIVLILMVCWSAVWIDPREIESRLTITIVCLLSLIAYNFVVDDDLPKLSYLTVMDIMILLSYFFSTLPTLITILNHVQKSDEIALRIDRKARIFIPLLYVFSIIIITFLILHNSKNTVSKFYFLA